MTEYDVSLRRARGGHTTLTVTADSPLAAAMSAYLHIFGLAPEVVDVRGLSEAGAAHLVVDLSSDAEIVRADVRPADPQ
jgi:hypothetical protein